jgi:hypothetical protein
VFSFSFLNINVNVNSCKNVNCPVELPGQVPVPDICNCPVSSGAQKCYLCPIICECFGKLSTGNIFADCMPADTGHLLLLRSPHFILKYLTEEKSHGSRFLWRSHQKCLEG